MKKVILAIMDGVGLSNNIVGNAVALSKPKFLNMCLKKFPNTSLHAGEEYVGLPKGQMGNSEVGHTNIGAGRIVPQTLFKINQLIENGEFQNNNKLIEIFKQVQKRQSTLHILGLLSDGGIHSHINHLFALLEMSKNYKIKKIALHLFLDGRDTEPNVSKKYLDCLLEKIKDRANIIISTVAGRYFAMDRENNWDRTVLSYQAIAHAEGVKYKTYEDFYEQTNKKIMDEFVSPFVIEGYTGVAENDTMLFFNFRADRMRQICYAFADSQLKYLQRQTIKPLDIYTLTDYGDKMSGIGIETILKDETLKNTLTEVLIKNNLKVLKVAESTKYAHVTYFLNGGREQAFNNEDRILIPSDNIQTFDLKPKMQAKKIAREVIKSVKSKKYDVIILNFANGDMVGHSGNLNATIKAIKCVDNQLKNIYCSAVKNDYLLVITADHGNAEKMLDEKGVIWTAHTLNVVPFIICDNNYTLRLGNFSLSNVAPTLLEIMNISLPEEMTAQSMIDL